MLHRAFQGSEMDVQFLTEVTYNNFDQQIFSYDQNSCHKINLSKTVRFANKNSSKRVGV